LTTDASSSAIGAILAQEGKDGRRRMIYAFSRNMEAAQLNYSVTDKELLALVKGIEHFRHFLIGKEFFVETDHKALEYLWKTKDQNTRLLRWSLKLQEYTFTTRYIKGEDNAADGLSRPIERIVNTITNIQDEFEPETKRRILLAYHLQLGHGSINNMKFAFKCKYFGLVFIKILRMFAKNVKYV
jgi:hypothetical protein